MNHVLLRWLSMSSKVVVTSGGDLLTRYRALMCVHAPRVRTSLSGEEGNKGCKSREWIMHAIRDAHAVKTRTVYGICTATDLLVACLSHQSHRPSFQPVRHRSSTLVQSNSSFPSFLLTSLCASQSHCPNSALLLTRGAFLASFIHF